LISPLILLLCLLVYAESGGDIFYRDYRLGRDGVLFSCIKFRTMVPGAEAVLQRLLKENAEIRAEYMRYHKLRHDPRVTRVGRVLRRTSLDELPQLWNVLRGEMSLVGPRPYLARESGRVGGPSGMRSCAFLRGLRGCGRSTDATTRPSRKGSNWTPTTCTVGRFGWIS
jgi:lipopolysaccharide/colanic/teichoic acid biosynthesis glycosyltransferase